MTAAAAIRSEVERGDPFACGSGYAMFSRIEASQGVGGSDLPLDAAGADHPVADDAGGLDAHVRVVVADTDGQDTDAMEHSRQSRLSRWQRLP